MTRFNYYLFIILTGLFIDGFSQTAEVSIQSVNSEVVGLYEKFEINVAIENVTYSNPYDPEQVDLRTEFTAPSGKVWEIFGFYDNYNGANQWKIRFAANEIGSWSYQLTLQSVSGFAQSPDSSFDVVDSDYHGWINVSPVNSHYFVHDDGSPYYAIGPYFPWNVNNSSTDGLAKLQVSGCNFWGYWNIMYDTGEIIESMNSGLGRYDQPKCGHIDKLINWSEDRDLKMMLAIWPHDLLSNTVWAHQWHQNPYNTVCSVQEFFESEIAWDYQQKQYRYIIARWGYSRALAVWEIVNEVNGTDGWQLGKEDEARIWIGKVHDYLKANDPHNRPTTASQSGGIYWPAGYQQVDIPNVHVYETDWSAEYLGNPLRSSAYTYYLLANQFWNDFDKPAIFGEAGYLSSYGNYSAGSDGYTAMFHNALWASWAGGMAATPVWWSFTSRDLMTNDVMGQIHSFSKIAKDYNYAYQNFQPYEISANDCDVYAMRSDSSVFGWVRQIHGNAVADNIINFSALEDTSYKISWYDTWTAEMIGQSFIVGADTLVTIRVPQTIEDIPDVAFFMEKTREGEIPAKIQMSSATQKIYLKRNEQAQILCTIHDAQDRFVRQANNPIHFQVEGPGQFIGSQIINSESGRAKITFTDDGSSGLATIIASSAGLISDTLTIEISNLIWIDSFENYQSLGDLEFFWFIRAGTSAEISLANSITGEAGSALKIDYTLGNGNAPYAGIHILIDEDLSASELLEFWLKGDASNRTLALLIYEKNGRYWQYDYNLSGSEAEFMQIPFNAFNASDTAKKITLDQIDDISFNILAGNGGLGQGSVYFDDIKFVIPSTGTGIRNDKRLNLPDKFALQQNYPNPFNPKTMITYVLKTKSNVKLKVYDITGRKIKTLIEGSQSAGRYKVEFNASGLSSGIYFYTLSTSGGLRESRKMILLN